MAKKGRISGNAFALRRKKKYPVNTVNAARASKGAAAKQHKGGSLSTGLLRRITKRANRALARGKRKSAKKK